MPRHLLLLPLTLLLFGSASAQLRYTFKDTTTPYVSLGSSATSLTSALVWDDDNISAPMPFTWTIDSTLTTNNFLIALSVPGVIQDTNNFADLNGFLFGDVDLADRSIAGAPKSHIRYLTTGTAPNRIFKVEFAGAGFYDEYSGYRTMNDSASFQVWVYETSNIVELRYGPSKITYPGDYFYFGGGGPAPGYGKHLDYVSGDTGTFYFLKGNPASPTVDSINAPNIPTTSLNSWPASGKVYRFTPKKKACIPPSAAAFTASVPSTGKTVQYTYTGATAGIDSLLWNWGDGQKQKVTSGFTMPISHTFASNGRYTVTVTAYNACGTSTSSKQTALAVGSIDQLGDVQVYPNPAADVLRIEGLEAGSHAEIRALTGQLLLEAEITSSRQMLSVASLPAGSYILLLHSKAGISGVMRLIKQ